MESELSRSQLYEEVWRSPLREIASRYGVSDVGLAKLCDRLEIPRPKQGHWTRISRGGSPPERPALPKIGDEPEVVLRPSERRRSAPGVEAPKVQIRRRVTNAHDAVAAFQNADVPKWPSHQDARPRDTARAVRVLDALFRALESRGHTVDFDKGHSFRAQIGRETVDFRLREKLSQTQVEERWGTRHKLDGTGQLQIRIDEYSWNGHRKSWSDGKTRPLETLLGQVVVGIEAIGEEGRIRRLEREEEERRRAAAWRVEEGRRRKEALHAEAVDELLKLAEDRDRADSIRRFLKQLATTSPANELAREWIPWASRIADWLDPLCTTTRLSDIASLLAAADEINAGDSPARGHRRQ